MMELSEERYKCGRRRDALNKEGKFKGGRRGGE